MQYEEPNGFSKALIEKFTQVTHVGNVMKNENITSGLDDIKNEDFNQKLSWNQDKCEKLTQLKKQLETTQREQVTDIYADFPTRLGRYVKIKLLKFTLNKFTL